MWLEAVKRRAPDQVSNVWRAIQYRFNNTLSADSLVGEMAEARYYSLSNRILTLLREGKWIEDADDIYQKIVGQAPIGGRAPVIDFTLKRLRSLNPLELIRGKINGQPLWEPGYEIVSSKAGRLGYTVPRLRDFFRFPPNQIAQMDKAWENYLNRAIARRGVSNSETLIEIERRLANTSNLGGAGRRMVPPMNARDLERLFETIRDNTTSIGTRQSLLDAIEKPSILPTAGRLVKGSYVGAAISGVFSGVTNYQNYQSGKISGSRAIGNTVSDAIGGGGAAMTGMAFGAAVGSIVPGAGTIVGAGIGFVAGAAAGAVVGYAYDKTLQKPISDAVTTVADVANKATHAVADGAKQVFGGIGSGLSKVFG